MSTIIRFTVVAAVFGFFLISPTYAEVSGLTRDVAKDGLNAIGHGLFALGVGIAAAVIRHAEDMSLYIDGSKVKESE